MKTLREWNIAARRAALKQRQKDVMADFKERSKERQDAVKKAEQDRNQREQEAKVPRRSSSSGAASP